jgi:hypothetical protein
MWLLPRVDVRGFLWRYFSCEHEGLDVQIFGVVQGGRSPRPCNLPLVGLHSIPGILLFDIICCTKIPEFSKACALKNRIGIDAAT